MSGSTPGDEITEDTRGIQRASERRREYSHQMTSREVRAQPGGRQLRKTRST